VNQEKKKLQNKLDLAVGVANSASTIAIMALTSSNGRKKAHGEGTKLAKSRRYLARHGRLKGVFLTPLRLKG